MAHALLEQGMITEAIQLAHGLVECDPQSADGHLMLGCARLNEGDVEAAVESLLQSHRLKPEAAMPISSALFL